MKRLYVPTVGPCQWQTLLADPRKQWKRGCSAFELAVSWEAAKNRKNDSGLPFEVAAVLQTSESTKDSKLLFAFPEHQVGLDNDKAPSQSDVWVLLRNKLGLISVAIEGKTGEPFADTVTTWLEKNETPARRIKRLQWLCDRLKASDSQTECGHLRYQLFHRTAAALKEADRFGAFAAVVLVQAFPGAEKAWNDFLKFGEYLGGQCKKERLARASAHTRPELYLGWAACPRSTDAGVALVMVAQNAPEETFSYLRQRTPARKP